MFFQQMIKIPKHLSRRIDVVVFFLCAFVLQSYAEHSISAQQKDRIKVKPRSGQITQYLDRPSEDLIRERMQTVFQLSNKEIYEPELPRMLFFRSPEVMANSLFRRRLNDPHILWRENIDQLDGVITKCLNEEVREVNKPALLAYLGRYAFDHPRKLMILHFSGVARDPEDTAGKYFAGHWIYRAGATATQDVPAASKRIYLPKLALRNFSLQRGLSGPNRMKKPDDIVMVRLDRFGNKLWNEAEHATLTAIGPDYIEVDRGKYGTRPLGFKAGRVWVAPHLAGGPWGGPGKVNNLVWYYNFSTLCPRDANGQNASDVLANEFAEWFSINGPLYWLQGVQFDIAYWEIHKQADINLDGKNDGGFVRNQNVYALGCYQFYKQMKKAMGPNRLLLADCFSPESQLAVDVIDGMENEGFSAPDDPYMSNWASTLNRIRYWDRFNPSPHKLNYITIKDKGPEQGRRARGRLAFAASTILGIPVTSTFLNRIPTLDQGSKFLTVPDEARQGAAGKLHWLGKPVAPPNSLANQSEDLLSNFEMNPRNWSKNAAISANAKGVLQIVFPESKSHRSRVKLKIPDLPGGDIVINAKLRASGIEGFGATVPRNIHCFLRVNGKSVRIGNEGGEFSGGFNTALAGSVDFSESEFYFRNTFAGKAELVFEADAKSKLWMKELTVRSAIPVMYREFENGVVVANPSLKTIAFPISKIFPNSTLKHLTSLEKPQHPQSGLIVGESIAIGALDGVFLEKIR